MNHSNLAQYSTIDFTDYKLPKILYHDGSFHAFDVNKIVVQKHHPYNSGQVVDFMYQLPFADGHMEVVDIKIKAPGMMALWGLAPYKAPNTQQCVADPAGNIKYTLSLSYMDIADGSDYEAFYKTMQKLDIKILNEIFARREQLFTNPVIKAGNKDFLQSMYKGATATRVGKNGQEYPPMLKLKTTKAFSQWRCKAYGPDLEEIVPDSIEKECVVKSLFTFKGVWFGSGAEFSPILQIDQIQLVKNRDLDKCVLGMDCNEEASAAGFI